ALRPGVVGSRTFQRSRARRARLRSADLRQVSGCDINHRAARPDDVRLAHAPLVDAAFTQRGDVSLRGGARGAPASYHPLATLDFRHADRAVWRHDYRAVLRGLEAGVWSGTPGPHSG